MLEKRAKYIAFIRLYVKSHGCPPSSYTVAREFGVTASTANKRIIALEKAGLVPTRQVRLAREIPIAEKPKYPECEPDCPGCWPEKYEHARLKASQALRKCFLAIYGGYPSDNDDDWIAFIRSWTDTHSEPPSTRPLERHFRVQYFVALHTVRRLEDSGLVSVRKFRTAA